MSVVRGAILIGILTCDSIRARLSFRINQIITEIVLCMYGNARPCEVRKLSALATDGCPAVCISNRRGGPVNCQTMKSMH